jgi:hypothetical protein
VLEGCGKLIGHTFKQFQLDMSVPIKTGFVTAGQMGKNGTNPQGLLAFEALDQ